MNLFTTQAEMHRLGAPVVRLFRTAFGYDPDPNGLMQCVARLRDGDSLIDVARALTESPEFQALHGTDAPPDEGFIARIQANALGFDAIGRAALAAAAGLGASRAELVAVLAESPAGRERIPLLPGLTPGAPPDDPTSYRLWVEAYDTPDPRALSRLAPAPGPRVTVALAVGDTEMEATLRTAASLQLQTYPVWELIIAARLSSAWPAEALDRLTRDEPRVRAVVWPAGSTRAAGLGEALAPAEGGFACVVYPGDRLAPTALQEVVAEFAAHQDAALIYTDEDVWDGEGRRAPRLKPGFSPDAAKAGNVLGQLAVYGSWLLRRIGGLRPDAGPFEAYDLALRAADAAGAAAVRHLPAVLCHCAVPPIDCPAPAIRPLQVLRGVEAREGTNWPWVRPHLPDPPPAVTVIVPTRDRPELLQRCMAGLLDHTDYPHLEVLVVDNGSTDPASRDLLARLDGTPRVQVLRDERPFNFAALNNAAASQADGDILLLLNNDTEVLHADWLREIAAHTVRPDVGVVGARLLYPDGTVQHAGILLGPNGAATHVGRGAGRDDAGYLGQLACTRDLSAVTGACLAIRREVWSRVGGMDERLAVTWNDVDLCLRVRAAGLRVVWTPFATLIHHEGLSRGLESADPRAQARFAAEQAVVRSRWGDAVDNDPFLNPNLLATEAGPLALTRPRRRRPWQ